MAVKKKKATTKRKVTTKRAACKPTLEVSRAGRLLSTRRSKRAGKLLATQGKEEKRKRISRGCLDGTGEFKLAPLQKKKLPKALQAAILKFHKKTRRK